MLVGRMPASERSAYRQPEGRRWLIVSDPCKLGFRAGKPVLRKKLLAIPLLLAFGTLLWKVPSAGSFAYGLGVSMQL